MGQRVIPCKVINEYISGDGVMIGAVGSHDDVLIELDFTAAGPMWDGTTKTVTFTNALGQDPVNILLGNNLRAEGQTKVYCVPVPAQAKAVEGFCGMTVTGAVIDGENEIIRCVTERSLFRVRPSEVQLWEGTVDVPASAAEQLQAEIDIIQNGTTLDTFGDVETVIADIRDGTDIDSFGDVESALDLKLNKPVSPDDPDGTAGQFLMSKGDGGTEWVDFNEDIVENVLAEHPEWTTTVQDGAVTTPKIANGAVTSAKIADGTIATGDLADSAVTTAKVADASVTRAKLASGVTDELDGLDTRLTTVEQSQTSPYNFKGTVASLSDLPSTGNTINDTYYVESEKYRVTWTGSAWAQSSMDETDYTDELADLESDLDATNNDMNKLVGNIQGYWGLGGLYAETGIEYNASNHIRTPFIAVKAGDTILVDNPDTNLGVTVFEFAENTTTSSGVNEKLGSYTTTATKTSITLSGSTNYIRLQMQTADTLKGDDVLVYTEDSIVFQSIGNVQSALDGVTAPTRNLWTLGEKSFVTSSGIFAVDLPAGTYTLSADVSRVSTAPANQNSRIIFYKEGETSQENIVGNPYLTVNVGRNSTTFTLSEPAVKATILAVVDNDGSAGVDCAWEDIQIESGSQETSYVPPVTAVDFIAREDADAKITRNLWTWGDQSFIKYVDVPISLPAGSYMVSANIVSRQEGAEALSYNARFEYYSGDTSLGYILLSRNARSSVQLTLSQAITKVRLFATNTSANSNGVTSVWSDIQIEAGTYATNYIPPKIVGVEPPKYSDVLLSAENLTITKNWRFFFAKQREDTRCLLIDIDAKITGNGIPEMRVYYTTGDMGSDFYIPGGFGDYEHKQFRMVPWPKYTEGPYVNAGILQFNVPSGCTLEIRSLTIRYDDSVSRPINSGLYIDSHGAFMMYPQHTLPAANAAQKCGATRFITIPKVSSDGVWFAYHDDTFNIATTILRNADGSVIESSEYNGMSFDQIPWSYLSALTVSKVNSYNAFSGIHLMKIEDMYKLCNKTGMKPMFSLHPSMTAEQAQGLYDLTAKYGLVSKLTLKPASPNYMSTIYPVFGDEVESYGLILERAEHTDTDVQGMIDWFDNSVIDKTKVRCYIELWIDLATPTQVQMILDAGYSVSLAGYTHTDPAGNDTGYISGSDYNYWTNLGVTEFTDSHNTSMGLNW